MMPQLVTVRVHSGGSRRIRLWIPVLPVLLLLSPILLLVAVASAAVCLAYRVHPGRALYAGWRLVSSLGGTRIEVEHGRTAVLVSLR